MRDFYWNGFHLNLLRFNSDLTIQLFFFIQTVISTILLNYIIIQFCVKISVLPSEEIKFGIANSKYEIGYLHSTAIKFGIADSKCKICFILV